MFPSLIPALREEKQEDEEFKVTLKYVESLRLPWAM